jgi:hypothetical protein
MATGSGFISLIVGMGVRPGPALLRLAAEQKPLIPLEPGAARRIGGKDRFPNAHDLSHPAGASILVAADTPGGS